MERVRINAAGFEFIARFESERAPQTCVKFRTMLPYNERINGRLASLLEGGGAHLPPTFSGKRDAPVPCSGHAPLPASA
jgi:hypothetical protein